MKISEASRVTGLKDEQQAAIDAQKINEGKVREEMKQLAERKAKLEAEAKKQGKTLKEYDKEAAEEIRTQEAEHQHDHRSGASRPVLQGTARRSAAWRDYPREGP